MISIKKQMETGKLLLKEFHRLDKEITDQRLTQSKDTYAILTHEIKFFGRKAEKYVNSSEDFVNSTEIHLASSQHEYVNDYEVDSPALRDFYSYGIAIEQIVKELEALTKGSPKAKRKHDGKFYYIPEERVLYRNETDMRIKSRQLKRETLVEMVFRYRGKLVNATDIERKRAKKYGGPQYELYELPYPWNWIRKACDAINKKVEEVFNIDYELLEKEEEKVKLNDRAK